jgi:hypothetical protein
MLVTGISSERTDSEAKGKRRETAEAVETGGDGAWDGEKGEGGPQR